MQQTYRNSDPWTSSQEFNRPRLKEIVLEIVGKHPGFLAGEIEEHGKAYSVSGLWKRISELHRDGYLMQGEAIRYSKTGKYQRTWFVREHQISMEGV
jgi:hypothetical protein